MLHSPRRTRDRCHVTLALLSLVVGCASEPPAVRSAFDLSGYYLLSFSAGSADTAEVSGILRLQAASESTLSEKFWVREGENVIGSERALGAGHRCLRRPQRHPRRGYCPSTAGHALSGSGGVAMGPGTGDIYERAKLEFRLERSERV